MTAKTTIIMTALNQGDWVRKTIPKAKKAMARWPYEIIVVDDHSIDGCCHGIDSDVLILRPETRLGISRARRFAVERAQGDVLLFSDPHCEYPERSLRDLAESASRRRSICLPKTISVRASPRFGGALTTSDRGLRVKRQYERPAEHPAMIGAIYAIGRETYEYLGGWPELPGVWGYSEQAMTLMAWFLGVSIFIDQRHVCTHHHYHEGGHFSYRVPLSDQAANGHVVHASFFPNTYPEYWRHLLIRRFGHSSVHGVFDESGSVLRRFDRAHDAERFAAGIKRPTELKKIDLFAEAISSGSARQMRKRVKRKGVRTEREFFDFVLHSTYPLDLDAVLIHQQRKRSKPARYESIEERQAKALEWFEAEKPGCIKGMIALDLGSRDGYALVKLEEMGAIEVQGVELIPEVAEFARSLGRAVVCGDMRQLAEADQSFDIVTAIHSLEHLPNPERARNEIFRVLRPGGYALIVVPFDGAEPIQKYGHNYCFPTPEHLNRFVRQSRLVDVKSIKQSTGSLHRGKKEFRILARRKLQ